MITSVLLSSSWISMDRSVSQTSCTSATSLTSSGGDGTCSQLSRCSLVRFCSSVHCRPGFKLCPRKLHSFFVQLLPDFVHLQLLQSSIQLSPSSLAVPLLSTQVTAFSPNLPGVEATNAPVSSSASWRTWQMTSPLSQEQSLWFPL